MFRKKHLMFFVLNIISLGVFLMMLDGVLNSRFMLQIDVLVSNFLQSNLSIALVAAMRVVTHLGDTVVILFSSLLLLFHLFKKRSSNMTMFFVSTMMASAISMFLLKRLVGRVRPLDGL